MEYKNLDLIVPICGLSTRFPGQIPKWALKKNNKTMLEMSIMGLSGYNRLFVVHLKKHRRFLENGVPKGAILIELPEQTTSQVDTVYKSLQYIDSNSFVVKDCDNYFQLDISGLENDFVGYYPLNKMTWMNVSNKSYLNISSDSNLNIMVEKQVISTNFGVGIYGILDRHQFCEIFIKNRAEYFSSVVNKINHSGKIVKCVEVKNYIDWGTIHDWNNSTDNIT